MAASPHRSAVTPSQGPPASTAAAAPLPTGWLWPVGALVALALLVAVVVQWQQLSLLRPTVTFDSNALVVATYRAEQEYLRLRERWPHSPAPMALPAAKDETDALAFRYEIFVSRVQLMRDGAHKRLLQNNPEFVLAMEQSLAFIAQADALFAQAKPGQPIAVQELIVLRPALEALAPAIHAMALRASHHITQQTTQRQETVRQHNITSIALTVFLSLLALAFAFIAFRQLRRLEQRRRALEELSNWLRESQQEAHAANSAKSTFLANMSHEIRTPFQGLMGMLSLMRETGLTHRQDELLSTATESADHLLHILNDILDMTQLESGRLALLVSEVNLRELMHGVEALMRPQALRKGLALHITVAPAVPERALLDATRVKQVLFNLMSNAIKFSNVGVVSLELQLVPIQGQQTLEFVVSDTGIGMDVTTQAGLFKRFSQGDNSPSRRFGGTGLGLEISRDLARLMGGDITVQSQVAVGSTFTFCMPLTPAPQRAPGNADAFTATPALARRLRVLVAEDHAINRQYLSAVLDGMGHDATFVANGQEAVHTVLKDSFQLVLMDLHMPVLDGIEATRAIRAMHSTTKAALPIVALTADAFETTRERCLTAGMNDFLTKPISNHALASCLRRLFGAGDQAAVAPDVAAAAPANTRSPVAARSTTPVLDHTTINIALQGMPRERLMALLSAFMQDGPPTLARLRAAMRDARTQDLQANAHAVRGAALNLGLSALAATAAALHEGAVTLPAHEIVLLVRRFEEQLEQSALALRAMDLLA